MPLSKSARTAGPDTSITWHIWSWLETWLITKHFFKSPFQISNKHILKEDCLAWGAPPCQTGFLLHFNKEFFSYEAQKLSAYIPCYRNVTMETQGKLPHPPTAETPSLCAAKKQRELPADISLKSKHVVSSQSVCILSVFTDELTVWLNLLRSESTTHHWRNETAKVLRQSLAPRSIEYKLSLQFSCIIF